MLFCRCLTCSLVRSILAIHCCGIFYWVRLHPRSWNIDTAPHTTYVALRINKTHTIVFSLFSQFPVYTILIWRVKNVFKCDGRTPIESWLWARYRPNVTYILHQQNAAICWLIDSINLNLIDSSRYKINWSWHYFCYTEQMEKIVWDARCVCVYIEIWAAGWNE